MINELIFLAHAIIISLFALAALRMGSQALVAFISVQCILANLFVIKQINLCNFIVTSSDAFTVGAVLGLNLLQEYFGREQAKKAIWISFGLLVFYALMTHIHLGYEPSACDTTHEHFAALLGFMPRIVIASLSVYLIVQHIESWLYAKIKMLVNGSFFAKASDDTRFLIIRNYISITISQFIDTVLFSFLGLYGIVENIWHIVFISYVIKLATIAVATPVIAFSKKIIK